jgi:amino acid adenylation domain-containing protein
VSTIRSIRYPSLVDLLRERADSQPNREAFSFLTPKDSITLDESSVTYAEIDRRARAIAALLQDRKAQGERALLLYPPGLDYIAALFGCFYAGVIAAPAYTPHWNKPMPRLQRMITSAEAKFALTTPQIRAQALKRLAQVPEFGLLEWLTPCEDAIGQEAAWNDPHIHLESIAFLQYTSGSTSAPKGVILTHKNLLHNLALIEEGFALDAESRAVVWLPPYHDMGLIGGILEPLYCGFPVTLMSPVTFLQRPYHWLQAITQTRGTCGGGPNFAYELCLNAITPEERETLDLSSWNVAFSGAEPIRKETIERFTQTFLPYGFRRETFYPCYGLAEATLIVTGGTQSDAPIVRTFQKSEIELNRVTLAQNDTSAEVSFVGCGRCFSDQKMAIVDPHTLLPCPDGQIGEIWLSGPSISQGYWNLPEETQAVFDAYLADTGAGPFFRSGDLGFLHEGELFVTGRLKDLIIIRGRNYYPQDIENTAEHSHPALRQGSNAAFPLTVNGTEGIVLVQEVERHYRDWALAEIFQSIQSAVISEHGVPLYAIVLIKPGSIPKTSSGKIQRHLCRDGFLGDSLASVALHIRDTTTSKWEEGLLSSETILSTNPDEQKTFLLEYLKEQVARVLGESVEMVDTSQPVYALGMDSLATVELMHALEANLNVTVSFADLTEAISIDHLVDALLQQIWGEHQREPISNYVTGNDKEFPLSYGQQALWFLYQMAPQSASYNISRAVRLHGIVDIGALREAFQLLTDRHPSLRTTFMSVNGKPVQHVHDQVEVAFHIEEASTYDDAFLSNRLQEEANRPFDLERGPIQRITIFSRSPEEYILLFSIHHIVADLRSLVVLLNELRILYPAVRKKTSVHLAASAFHYSDYVRWQQDMVNNAEGERHWQFWQKYLSGDLPTLQLPTDYTRPTIQTYEGAGHTFSLSGELTSRLNDLARSSQVTLYALLLSGFQVLLSRLSGQGDIIVGTPIANRSDYRLANDVGYFINTLPVRAELSQDPSFADFLQQTRRSIASVLQHQDYPLATIIERLQPERSATRSPLFQVMFTFQKAGVAQEDGITALSLAQPGVPLYVGELTVESFPLLIQTSQFDFTFTLAEVQGQIVGVVEYSTALFSDGTIGRIATYYRHLLEDIVAHPAKHLSGLSLLPQDESERLLKTWNATQRAYPHEVVHALVERQAERTPDRIALISAAKQMSYRVLNEHANQLAHYLRKAGTKPESRVGIWLDRTAEMVVALLGVLKAGGAYVPLDPRYPKERVATMLDDAQVDIILTQSDLVARLPDCDAITVLLDDWELFSHESRDNPANRVQPHNLAYVIYTSGSTGKPKGVTLEHFSASNFLLWMQDIFSASSLSGVLAATSISFDLSIFEIFGPLVSGGKVVLVDSILHQPEAALAGEVSLINTVPSALAEYLNIYKIPESVGIINLAGEPLSHKLIQRIYEEKNIRSVYNLYGPSEATTYATFARIDRERSATVPIGRPVANTQTYVLDAHMRLVPTGVVGELYIGGDGLARGYLNSPDLTAERFVPDPFSMIPGRRLYKTGDLVRYQTGGNLEYLGRIDHQIKIRGYRIELGEIEATLNQHPDVRESVVITYDRKLNDRRLIAYIVPQAEHLTEEPQLLSQRLQSYIRKRLPDYMTPTVIVVLSSFPLSPNGKIDRRALPLPNWGQSEREHTSAAPRSPTEKTLVSIWEEVLGVSQVGIYDNFFDLGGHSLLATQVLSRIREALRREIPLSMIFNEPTIAQISQAIDQEQITTMHRPISIPILPRSTADLNQYSAEELDYMLVEHRGDRHE